MFDYSNYNSLHWVLYVLIAFVCVCNQACFTVRVCAYMVTYGCVCLCGGVSFVYSYIFCFVKYYALLSFSYYNG